jgi:hypothetical protein
VTDRSPLKTAATNTTNTEWEWTVPTVIPWYGHLAVWVDLQIVHRLIWGSRWAVPQPLNLWLYRYCCWSAWKWDW